MRMSATPTAKLPEFRRRGIELVEPGESADQVAKGLGISVQTLRRWTEIDHVDSGRVEGLSSTRKPDLIEQRA